MPRPIESTYKKNAIFTSGKSVMIAHCLSSLWPGLNFRPWRSILRDFSLADHMCCLVHNSTSTKERNGAPLEKSLQSPEYHEMPVRGQGSAWSTAKKQKNYVDYVIIVCH